MNEEIDDRQQDGIAQEESSEDTKQDLNLEQEDYKAKYEELKNEHLRVYADFDNIKRRLEREKYQALEYAYEKFAKDLLPTLDALNGAKEAAKGNPAIAEGINLVMESLLKTLKNHGIEEIEAHLEFDPNLHDCIMQVPHPELEEGQIAQVMQKGYKYKGRTLRPSMVALVKK